MMRTTPSFLYTFLRAAEANRLTAYQDSAGVWTIGVGHTGIGIVRGLKITAAQSAEYLQQDVEVAKANLYRATGAAPLEKLTKHQYAALLSFVFNLGANPSWTIWKVLKAGQVDKVPAQLARFTKARVNGQLKVIDGLRNRRAAEIALWNTADVPAAAALMETVSEDVAPSSLLRRSDTPPNPTSSAKPIAASKTFWAGAATAGTGAISGISQVQALVTAQAAQSDTLARLAGALAIVVVGLGVAVMVIRWLDERAKHR